MNKLYLTMRTTFSNILFLIILAVSNCYSQECGTVYTGGDHILPSAILKNHLTSRSPVIQEIPMTIHIIRSNGQASIEYEDILERLNLVNQKFEPTGYKFVSCRPNYINTQFSSISSSDEDEAIHSQHRIPGTVNVYFSDLIVGACGWAVFPWADESEKRIFIHPNCINGGTFEHELGHLFGLLHTHSAIYGEELVSGINCETAGDLLCDTPADPTLGNSNVNTLCSYTGSSVDPMGIPYNPHTNNLMSYARRTCRNNFTNQQYAIMQYYMEESGLTYENSTNVDLSIELDEDFEINFGERKLVNIEIETSSLTSSRQVDLIVYLKEGNSRTSLRKFDLLLRSEENYYLSEYIELPNTYYNGAQELVFELNPLSIICETDFENNIQTYKVVDDFSSSFRNLFSPNPSTDFVTAKFNSTEYLQNLTVEVFNNQGQLVETKEDYVFGFQLFYVLPISNYPAGMYTARFKWSSGEIKILTFQKI